MKTDYIIIGRGKAGWHASGTTGKNKDTCSSTGGTLEHYLSEANDGCLVYDAETADDKAFTDWVFHQPMLNVRLPSSSMKQLFGEAAPCTIDTEFGALDSVSPDIYLAVLRKVVPGVRFGVVKDHKVEWEDTSCSDGCTGKCMNYPAYMLK
jgi:hypothetical protein